MSRRPRRTRRPGRVDSGAPFKREIQVVAIGASAGGLDAYRRFFKTMPDDSGLAFVLIQHLDPDHESHMAQLLSKCTSMKVREASDRTGVEANCVYIIPPNRSLTIRGGMLHLSQPIERRGLRTPIDHFFSSLAEDLGEKSVCIILSSTGTDGVLGLRAVKAAGGMAMVQDPSTAQYGDMPRTAIATGLVDYVLPVEQMPKALLSYLSHAYICGPTAVRPGTNDTEDGLARIQELLRARTTHDFRFYKRGTLVRRIERRMGLNQIQKLADYLKFLKKRPAEVVQLSKDLMIGVTSFFRDPAAFEELRARVIPQLVRAKDSDGPIRVWVPGCATGEEAYSITMLLLEELSASDRSNRVQVFATDIDDDALQFARISHYPESIAADVIPPRLKRYFTATEHGFLVNKPLRECVVFAVQNLITAPPFSKIDLICCRNVAIYLEPEIQKRLIELFHFALNPGGYLFLGSSEGVGTREDLFRAVSKKWRLYRRVGGGRRELADFPLLPPDLASLRPGELPPRHAPPLNLAELNQRLMLDHFSSASVLTDRKGRILHLTGPTDKYLELPSGEPSLDLPTIAREGLRSRLRTAIQASFRDDKRVVLERENVRRDGSYRPVRVTLSPVRTPPTADGLLHVLFEELPESEVAPAADVAGAGGDGKDGVVHQLENELKSTRDDLQNTIEELETSNEELKVANEEVLSSNEELQSTNEELETSKEELQSLNEELSTLNNQLQEKVQELTETTNDLANLLSSTEIATVFLDTKFRVKRFTSPVAKLLNLIPSDVGRPIRHMVQNLVGVDILEDAQTVLRKLVPIKRQVESKDGAWFDMRVLPYRTTENVIEGVVITFSDVSELASKEEQLREREMRQRIIVDLGHRALARTPLDRLVALATRRVQEVLGADFSDVLKLDESGRRLLLWGGAGWKMARIGVSEIPSTGSTMPAAALRSRAPLFMDGSSGSGRVEPSKLQRAERVVSCMYVALATPRGPFGLVGAHSRRKRAFTAEDGLFLQDTANVLANALSRERVESELKEIGRTLEERVRERTRWLEASQEVSRAANQSETMAEVMHRALVALCSGSGWRMGHVFLASREKPTQPVFHGSWYPRGSERFRPFERLARTGNLSGAHTLPSLVLQRGKPVWISEPAATPRHAPGRDGRATGWSVNANLGRLRPPRTRLARRLGIVTAAAVPLKVGRDTVGMVEVFSDKPMPPNRLMLDMMEQVATEIGRSVERMQSQERFAAALWREQRSIAQELHDSVGQELTGLGAISESLLGTLHRSGKIDAARLKRLTEGLQVTLERLRNVTRGLFPLEVEAGGLTPALARLAKHTQSRFGIACALKRGRRVPVPSSEIATHLYRIAQEAVTNAVRHARARRIDIALKRTTRETVLSVRDDGRGLPQGVRARDGVGLRIMRHRAKAIGGRLALRSVRNRGTVVACWFPRDGARMRDGTGS